MLAFSFARTEDTTSWDWFQERIVSERQSIRSIMSDCVKGLGDIGVHMRQHVLQIAHVRCSWHLISKKSKTRCSSGVQFSVRSFVCEDA